MKSKFLFLLLFPLAAFGQGNVPLNKAFLQTHGNGNGLQWTNLGGIKLTNGGVITFGDGTTQNTAGGNATNAIGLTNGTGWGTTFLQTNVAQYFIGNGGGLTNINGATALTSNSWFLATNQTVNATVSNSYNGTFIGNASGLTNYSFAGMPQILLDPPHIGASSNTGVYTFGTGNTTHGIMFSGCGMLRDIWVQTELGTAGNLNANMANLRLEIFCDGGNTTNLAFRMVDVSLADLFGNRFRFPTNGEWAVDRDSLGIYSQDRSTNGYSGAYIKAFQFRLPVYFTNYCLVRLTNSATGSIWNGGYINATVERAANLDTLGDYKTWRLRSLTTYGAVTGSASNYLFGATGPGLCVGWLQSLFTTVNGGIGTFTDSISVHFLTAPGTTWAVAGGDDFSLSTYYMRAGVSIGYRAGVVNRNFGPNNNDDSNGAVEFYRWFSSDALYWPNGVTIYIPDCEPLTAMSATMFYYAP